MVILALGEPRDWSGEAGSRSTLGLPGRQQELFDAIAATGKPVVVVLFNGRPLALPEIQDKAAAILEAWFPGIQGGNGVADILFGDVDPAGRLTTTFPRSVGQVPIYYNHSNTGRPGTNYDNGNYVDGPETALYPFGFGLAYTTFEYGKVQTGRDEIENRWNAHCTGENQKHRRACRNGSCATLHSRSRVLRRAEAGARIEGFPENFAATG